MEKKICIECKLEKPISFFGKSKGYKKDYPRSRCKVCAVVKFNEWILDNQDEDTKRDNKRKYYLKNADTLKKKAKKYHLRSPKINRASSLRRLYGIDLDEYDFLFKKQRGLCAICLKPNSTDSRKKRLSIDHCHTTGKVRGLLCGNCNSGLGLFQDDLLILRTAVKYLRESNSQIEDADHNC